MRIAAEFIIMLALIINWADIRGAPRQCQNEILAYELLAKQ